MRDFQRERGLLEEQYSKFMSFGNESRTFVIDKQNGEMEFEDWCQLTFDIDLSESYFTALGEPL